MPKTISTKNIHESIFILRGHKVMLSTDLAVLYNVEERTLIQAVKRNIDRFPGDFQFQLNNQELTNLKSQFVISSWGGRRSNPYAFTEQGIAMLSSVLNSKKAIQVNIQIMRTFVKLRSILASHEDLAHKLHQLEKKYDARFKAVFEAIWKLMETPKKPKRQIGFKIFSKHK